MARVEKMDRGMSARIDEVEKRIFQLKIQYEKYFSGLDATEPARERDELKRLLRDLLAEPVQNSRQRFVLQQLRSRFSSMELYWTRNLSQIERGVHPKQRFRAEQKERVRQESVEAARARALAKARVAGEEPPDESEAPSAPTAPRPPPRADGDAAYRAVYDSYIATRASCGQSTNLEFGAVRDALKKQMDVLRSNHNASSVRFRVVVEDGKARIKAVPVK